MKGDFYYFKVLGRYGVPPWRVYMLLRDKLKLTLNDLEVIERCYEVVMSGVTYFLYSMEDIQYLIYKHEDEVNIKINSLHVWYQMVQSMKEDVKK